MCKLAHADTLLINPTESCAVTLAVHPSLFFVSMCVSALDLE